ncbi:hypothetical protein [Priestia flexa]|jgi:hypothetical protein|uniref:hypothetical protein n=1 Tax=Priestia flexa TaxID=86664 RepID=UPI000E67E4C7|nr:hypothetical protein [Priestia flexa]MBN8435412.1 hypothetical protein [Priestia flexa]MCA0968011.1 hypothetical protein [Priestia flexa]RIV09253.1 hypothetical protein D1859_12320 [Priestia flexa]
MLKETVKEYIEVELRGSSGQKVELYEEEKDFAMKNELIPEGVTISSKADYTRFADAYVERVDKESENLLSEEAAGTFLKEPIQYVKNHPNEFIYIECQSFDVIRVEGVSVELDDVFRTYKVLLGLRQPKKVGSHIKAFLTNELSEGQNSFQALFNDKDGMWDINIDIESMKGFDENLSLHDTFELIYHVLFELVQYIDEQK